MPNVEILTRRLNSSPNVVREIPGAHEQRMFLLLQERLPGANIQYESHEFKMTDENGHQRSTIPDIRVEKPDGTVIFIELTTMELNGTDPKARQKEVMSQFPGVRYVVLYGQQLLNIQERRGVSLIGARKLKKSNSGGISE